MWLHSISMLLKPQESLPQQLFLLLVVMVVRVSWCWWSTYYTFPLFLQGSGPGLSPHFCGSVHPWTADISQTATWWFCRLAHIVPEVKQQKPAVLGDIAPGHDARNTNHQKIFDRGKQLTWRIVWNVVLLVGKCVTCGALLKKRKQQLPWFEPTRASGFSCFELSRRYWNLEWSSKNKHTYQHNAAWIFTVKWDFR